MIGFIAGVLAGISVGLATVDAATPDNLKVLLGIAAAGYAGTDFIENVFSKVIPTVSGAQRSLARASQTLPRDLSLPGPVSRRRAQALLSPVPSLSGQRTMSLAK